MLSRLLWVVLAITIAGCGATAPAQTDVPTASQTTTPEATVTPGTAGTSAAAPEVDTRVVDRGERGSFGVVTLPLDDWDVRVDWPQDPDGTDLGEYLAAHPKVEVLTNAGIFSDDLTPGGLLVADGEELRSLNLADGGGNFHLKPNAVFALRDDGTATITESGEFDDAGVIHATQSGPALVLDGEIHPEFTDGSLNTAYRSGVGVSPDGGTVFLAITRIPTNLWDFATLFRDELGVEDALYLDGQISQLWVAGAAEPTPFLGPYAGVIAVYRR